MSRTAARGRASSRYDKRRGAARARAERQQARAHRRGAVARQPRALGAMAFTAAFAVGVVVSTADIPFWVAFGADGGASIEHVSVHGHERLDAREIAARASIAPGTPATALDLVAVAARVRSHPWLRSARARVAGESELLVVVEERELAAVLHSGTTESYWAVEADGTPFVQIDPAAHPERLQLEEGLHLVPGEPHPIIGDALALVARIEASGLPRPESLALPGKGEAGALGWCFTLGAGGPEVVLGREPSDEQLARLAELLGARPDAVRSAERIDMRFRDRAILRTADTIPAEKTPASPTPSGIGTGNETSGALTARLGGRPASG